MENDLRTLVLSDAAVADLVGERLHPLVMPQAPTLPAITYQVISSRHAQSHSGVSGYGISRVQFSCYARAYDQVRSLALALLRALAAYRGNQTYSSPPIALETKFAILLIDERDSYEEEPFLWRKDLDFEVQWEYDAISRL